MKKLIRSFIFLIAVISAFAFNAQAETIYGYTSFRGILETDGTSLDDATTFDSFSDVVGSTHGGTYDLLSSHIDPQDTNQLNLQGTGIATLDGFEDTGSIWFLRATSAGERSTFTLSILVPSDYQPPSAVPEPATMILFGVGLLGFAGLARKRTNPS